MSRCGHENRFKGAGQAMTLVWKLLAILSLVLAVLAAVLPVVPAAPMILLAIAAADRGWPSLAQRLARHPRLGPLVANWRERGAMPIGLRLPAIGGLAFSGAGVWLLSVPAWWKIVVDVSLLLLGAWLWRRPSR